MKTIKIVVGTYGYRKDNTSPVELIDKKSNPIEVSDAEAERLIKAGVAVEVKETVAEETEDTVHDEAVGIGYLDAESLSGYTVPELKDLAKKLGLKTGGTKDELIERISAAKVEYPVSEDTEDAEAADDDEEPPVLNPADPE